MMNKHLTAIANFFLWFLFVPAHVFAHGVEEEHALESEVVTPESMGQTIEALMTTFTLRAVAQGFVLLALLIFIAVIMKRKTETSKRVLFWLITIVVIGTTLSLVGSTLLLNVNSVTKGPIHWHADFEVWACGEKLDPIDPKGLSNKIGTSSFHEHNDERIHFEGVVLSLRDASLGQFFKTIGGSLTSNSFVVPTNDGKQSFTNGETCPNKRPGEVQVFIYTVNSDNSFQQQKLTTPASYVLHPETQVPPGDCIIIEFDNKKEKTERLCRSYQTAVEIGKLKGEINDRH